MNKPIHPAVAEHAMEENEKLREALRCIADLPMDRCSTENDYRLSAAKAIALGALSQQAEPTDTFTAVDMATAAAQGLRDGQAAVEQAAAQDERNECRCTSERRLIGEGCRACNLDDDIHQLAFEVGDPAEDASGYWFDMESFNEFVQKLLPIIREPYEDVLRSLACSLGAGGYNAPAVDPAVFEQKIRWGIDQLTRPAQTEQQPEDRVPVTMKLPCEVKLPGGMTVGRGCQLSTLLLAMRDREHGPLWRQRFGQPQPFDPALLNLIADNAAPIAQTAPQPVAVPEGWKLVPIEPTEGMLRSAMQYDKAQEPGDDPELAESLRIDWSLMLDAAPIAQIASQTAPGESWIPWRGGECPVPPSTPVEYRMRRDARSVVRIDLAGKLDWEHHGGRIGKSDVVAYRAALSAQGESHE
ncbi:hypothetical protein [Stutzerimonas nitrititolerans]|uniref:hypothetical protein n=1 Tax=Stutzerimonas nitrititolerans TaxID=2482751 RepID=UPI00289D6B51|nr:hypothetical protein [Stutzerimonas nitrititolerans]